MQVPLGTELGQVPWGSQEGSLKMLFNVVASLVRYRMINSQALWNLLCVNRHKDIFVDLGNNKQEIIVGNR